MKKNPFYLLTSILSLFLLNTSNASDQMIRGLWVVRHEITTPEKIDSLLSIAARYQFSDLFVQVRGRGDAYYNSAHEPKAEGLDADFDPLHYLISQNRHDNIRIHAWINVFYLWSSDSFPKSPQHLLNQKPEWVVYPAWMAADSSLRHRKGDSEGWYNSPLLPEVQQHIFRIAEDIISKYEVDGIHLDYIRFPGRDFDYHPAVRHSFKKTYLLDPLEFKIDKEAFVDKYSQVGYELYYNRWTRFLRDGLSEFVKTLWQQIKRENGDIIISAAVKADMSEAHLRFYQEWDRWLKEGWIDWAVPMNYTVNNVEFLNRIRRMVHSGMMNKLLIGISLYNQSESAAIDKVRAVNDLSMNGFVLFSYKQFRENKKLQSLYFQEVQKIQE